MLSRRLLAIAAVLMALTLLTAILSPQPSDRSPAPARPPASAPADAGSTVEASLDAGAAEPRTVAVEAGDVVRLEVTSDAADTVELVGLDRIAVVGPETPAVFDLLADEPGRYEVRLRESGRLAGTLRVSPAQE